MIFSNVFNVENLGGVFGKTGKYWIWELSKIEIEVNNYIVRQSGRSLTEGGGRLRQKASQYAHSHLAIWIETYPSYETPVEK